MTVAIRCLQIDSQRPEQLAAFWKELLGFEERGRLGEDDPQYLAIHGHDRGVTLCFQRVAEAKIGKNRLHLDLTVGDIEDATERITALGGSRLPKSDFHENGSRWRVLADPEGNEFCVEVQD
jgi:predicted enzyme related to lactoylglutathione lyase